MYRVVGADVTVNRERLYGAVVYTIIYGDGIIGVVATDIGAITRVADGHFNRNRGGSAAVVLQRGYKFNRGKVDGQSRHLIGTQAGSRGITDGAEHVNGHLCNRNTHIAQQCIK